MIIFYFRIQCKNVEKGFLFHEKKKLIKRWTFYSHTQSLSTGGFVTWCCWYEQAKGYVFVDLSGNSLPIISKGRADAVYRIIFIDFGWMV